MPFSGGHLEVGIVRGLQRTLLLGVVIVVAGCCYAAAAGLTEIGIQFAVTREPSILQIEARWTLSAGAYARFGVDEVWSIRSGLGASLDDLSPYAHVSILARVGPRIALSSDVIAQWHLDPGIFGMGVRLGGVYIAAAGPDGRVTLATSPLTWSLLRIDGRFRNTIAFTPDLTLDAARQTEDGLLVGSAATISLVHGPDPADPWKLGWRVVPHLGLVTL